MTMNVRVKWNENLQFVARAGNGPAVVMDSSDGKGGATPMELLLMGAAGCTAIDVVLILEKKRQKPENFEILVEAEQAEENPKRFTHIRMEYVLYGKDIKASAVEHAIELSEKKYCSAMASLNAQFSHTYRIVDSQ